jgi:hypothetical protein
LNRSYIQRLVSTLGTYLVRIWSQAFAFTRKLYRYNKDFFYLKMKDNTLNAAIHYLRERGLFNDDDDDDEEEDNPAADFEW